MATFVKYALLFYVAATLVSCAPARPRYTGISIRYPVLLALADIQRYFPVETAYCLEGRVSDDGVVFVDNLYPTVVTTRDRTSAVFLGCRQKGTVAWYHNHPPQDWDACAASSADIELLEKWPQYHALLISCGDKGVFIYRFKGEDRDYRIDYDSYRPPWAANDSTG